MYQRQTRYTTSRTGEQMGTNFKSKVEKLVPNLFSKTRYVVHYRNLKYYVAKGLIVTKIHRILSFKQSAWLAKYIDFNTNKRALASSQFEKDFFKLANNAFYGKTMEDVRRRINLKLVRTEKEAKFYTAQPTFDSFKIVNEDVTTILMKKTSIYWDKPTYLGFCILDLSKLHMYEFHYDYMMQRYGHEHARLLFTDTDSLTYAITTEDVYTDMKKDERLFDTSDYPKDHLNRSTVNAKVVGKFKDECNGERPLEFVGLRSKMYSLQVNRKKTKATLKGVKTGYVKKFVTHDHYRDCLFKRLKTFANFSTIRSVNHQLRTDHVTKVALNSYDDKRYLLDDGISTLAFGHCKIENN